MELTYLQNGTACGKFSLAVNEGRKGSDGQWNDVANYFDVTVWGKTAENLKAHLAKGKQIAVSGHLKQDRWQKDGQNFSKVYIVVDALQLVGSKPENKTEPAPQNYEAETAETFSEDIPF